MTPDFTCLVIFGFLIIDHTIYVVDVEHIMTYVIDPMNINLSLFSKF